MSKQDFLFIAGESLNHVTICEDLLKCSNVSLLGVDTIKIG